MQNITYVTKTRDGKAVSVPALFYLCKYEFMTNIYRDNFGTLQVWFKGLPMGKKPIQY